MDRNVSCVVESKENIEFINSNKGHLLLVMNQYVYKCSKKTSNKKYWTCTVKHCNVHLHTALHNNYLCGGKGDHSHAPNPEFVLVRQTRQRIKLRVTNEQTPVGKIYDEELATVSMNSTAISIFPTVHEMC